MMNPMALHRSFQGRTDLRLLRPARVRSGRLFIAVVALGSSAANAQDMTASARLFASKCQVCHSVDPAKGMGLGPNLSKVVGRKAASVTGFPYSAAMSKSQIQWDLDKLDAFLTAPQRLVPGTRMAFAGLSSPTDRSQIIAFLASKTQPTDQR